MDGKGYKSSHQSPTKSRNIIHEGSKTKNGTQRGYLYSKSCSHFKEEEILKPPKSKSLSKSNLTSVSAKKADCLSVSEDEYGTISIKKNPKKTTKSLPNFLSNPGKKGGPGYADICLSKYPKHISERQMEKKKKTPTTQITPFISVHCPRPCFDPNPFCEVKQKPNNDLPKIKPTVRIASKNLIPTRPAKPQESSQAGKSTTSLPHQMTKRDPEWEKRLKKERALLMRKLEGKGRFGTTLIPLKTMETFTSLTLDAGFRARFIHSKVYGPGHNSQYQLSEFL